VLVQALAAGALAPDYVALLIARVLAGLAGGGMIPVAFAIIGDRFAVAERQVALARVVMASQTAILLSAGLSGLIAARFNWRVVFGLSTAVAVMSLTMMVRGLPSAAAAGPVRTLNLRAMGRVYGVVFRSPMARYVLPSVAIEGIVLFGLLPFVAHRLELRGRGGAEEAGLVLAAMSVGGITFTLLVGRLLARLGRGWLIRVGGLMGAIGLCGLAVAPWWQLEAVCFAVLGFGFFMVHNSLQLLATELVPEARSSSIAMFAFCFFLGQAVGPVLYHAGFDALGLTAPLLIAACLLLAMALGMAAVVDRTVARSG
jgi:predicted MFS family arabinose efflux permease